MKSSHPELSDPTRSVSFRSRTWTNDAGPLRVPFSSMLCDTLRSLNDRIFFLKKNRHFQQDVSGLLAPFTHVRQGRPPLALPNGALRLGRYLQRFQHPRQMLILLSMNALSKSTTAK